MTTNENQRTQENEDSVLGCILLDGNNFEFVKYKGLHNEHFYSQKNQIIFKAMEELFNDNIEINVLSVNDQVLKTGNNLTSDIASLTGKIPSGANIDYYVSNVIDLYKKRKTSQILKELEENIKKAKTQDAATDLLDDASEKLQELSEKVFCSISKTDYEKTNARSDVYELIQEIDSRTKGEGKKGISTGFNSIDELLDGGLYPALYTIGAVSSAGKTTLTLQIADAIARTGTDVLYFSLEMAKNELVSKSLSRLTYQKKSSEALTTRQILSSKKITLPQAANLQDAANDYYNNYSGNLFFNIGIGDIGVDTIKKAVRTHIYLRNKTPVIFIDYLQILAQPEDKDNKYRSMTDKQIIDKNIVELKRISRDFNTPVFAISSFNRLNYKEEVNMAALKESGSIEYTSDVVLGLQHFGMGKDIINLEALNFQKAKNGEDIPMELKILKNRTGVKDSILLMYKPKYETFRDTEKNETRASLLSKIKAENTIFSKEKDNTEVPKLKKL